MNESDTFIEGREHCWTDINCTQVDSETCTFKQEAPITDYQILEFDEDGCYNFRISQATKSQFYYTQFSLILCVMTMVVGSLGIIGNTISIIVLSQKEMKNCFNQLLIVLNICDSAHIVFAIMDGVRNDFKNHYPDLLLHIYPFFHYPLYRISLCASIYMTMSMAVERYLAVCCPHHFREVQSRAYRVLLYIVPALVAAILFNISKFMEIEVVTWCFDFSNCGCGYMDKVYPKIAPLRLNKYYTIFYHLWGWIIVTGIIPFAVLSILNFKVYSTMKRMKQNLNKRMEGGRTASTATTVTTGSRRPSNRTPSFKNAISIPGRSTSVRNNSASEDGQTQGSMGLVTRRQQRVNKQNKENNLALIMMATVLAFLGFHLPRLLTNVYEGATIHSTLKCHEKQPTMSMDNTPYWFLFSQATIQIMQVLNASVNLPIYLLVGKSFRKTFLNMFSCCPLISSLRGLQNTGRRNWEHRNCSPKADNYSNRIYQVNKENNLLAVPSMEENESPSNGHMANGANGVNGENNLNHLENQETAT